jgi:hypothetical protein
MRELVPLTAAKGLAAILMCMGVFVAAHTSGMLAPFVKVLELFS